MGFLGDIFNDVVDITTSPISVGAKITDSVLDSDTLEAIEALKKVAKVKKD